jgi:hypothetical protein
VHRLKALTEIQGVCFCFFGQTFFEEHVPVTFPPGQNTRFAQNLLVNISRDARIFIVRRSRDLQIESPRTSYTLTHLINPCLNVTYVYTTRPTLVSRTITETRTKQEDTDHNLQS